MRGLKNEIKPSKYYILSTDIKVRRRYALLNKEFNTKSEAQYIINTKLKERKLYNQIIKGDIAIKFDFEFRVNNISRSNRWDCYLDLVKYNYPGNRTKMTMQQKKSFRTKQRRIWRRKHRGKGNRNPR